MPKSKRARVIHTSKVQKKDSSHSASLFTSIREASSVYTHILVFTVSNMRNTYLKDVRAQLPNARIFFGKTTIMRKALGDTTESEVLPCLSDLTKQMRGSIGLLFTNQEPTEVQEFLASYTPTDFARAGTTATESFVVPAGTVYSRGGAVAEEDDVPVAHTQESNLKRFGMPTRLVKGKIIIEDDYIVAEEGKELDSKAAALLKIFGVTMAVFEVRCVARYDAGKQETVVLQGMPDDE